MPPPTIAVLDTNVLLDIFSCHDVTGRLHDLRVEGVIDAIDDPSVRYRLARAREAAVLAMYLNKIAATTYSLHSEPIHQIRRLAPPVPGGTTLESDFAIAFVHYVKPYVLPAWTPAMPEQPDERVGNAADRAVLTYASEHNLPLVTSEGYTTDGKIDARNRMRKLARDVGTAVFTPREFYASEVVEIDEIEAFLQRFRDEAPGYLAQRRETYGADDGMDGLLGRIYGYYRLVLRGEVEGRDAPVRVTLA